LLGTGKNKRRNLQCNRPQNFPKSINIKGKRKKVSMMRIGQLAREDSHPQSYSNWRPEEIGELRSANASTIASVWMPKMRGHFGERRHLDPFSCGVPERGKPQRTSGGHGKNSLWKVSELTPVHTKIRSATEKGGGVKSSRKRRKDQEVILVRNRQGGARGHQKYIKKARNVTALKRRDRGKKTCAKEWEGGIAEREDHKNHAKGQTELK